MWYDPSNMTLGLFGPIGTTEMIVLAILGLLIFGKRLPEVGKSVGRGIVEFKRGLSGIEDDIENAAKQPPQIERHQAEQTDATSTGQAEPTRQADNSSQGHHGNQAHPSA